MFFVLISNKYCIFAQIFNSNNMKKLIFSFFVSITLCISTSAQSELIYKSNFFESGVFQNGTKLKPKQVREVISENSEALDLYNNGRTLLVAGCVISYPCAAMLGWDLGVRTGGGEGNGTLLAIGAVGTVVGLIMGISGEKKMKNSVQLYNSKASNNAVSYQVNFGFTQTGVGFSICF